MAIIHQATLTPTKAELVTTWLRSQSWANLPEGSTPVIAASYRFDDPAGNVGIEVMLVKVPGPGIDSVLIQLPLSYRGAPLAGADAALIGTTEHSVLGKRWVYDATADPVFAAEAVRTIVASGESARFMVQSEAGEVEKTDGVAHAYGTGAPAGTPPELRGASADASSLPVVQEVEGMAVVNFGDYRLAVLRFPSPVDSSALDAPAGQLRVQLPGNGSVLAARLLD